MNNEIDPTNLWQSKPWWCQPWTIILTGIVIITGSWLLFKTLWLTVPITFAIVVWWVYFLVIVPRLLLNLAQDDRSSS